MSELPTGWILSTIQELSGANGLVTDGDWIESKDQDPNGDVRLIQLADIGDGNFRDRSSRFLTSKRATELACTFLERGDVLVARMPDPLGRACIFPGVNRKSVTAVDVLIWRGANNDISNQWLVHFINSPDVRKTIAANASGTTRQRISGGKLKTLSLPVPPAGEQRRIVAKIDSLSSKSKRASEHLDHIPRLVEKYKRAILLLGSTGELTSHWRDRRGAAAWPHVNVERLARVIFDGPFGSHLKSDDYVQSGVRVVRLENIGHLRFVSEKQTYISREKYASLTRHTLQEKDVLLSSFVDEEVRVCVLPDGLGETTINKADCFCIRADSAVCDPAWLAYRLACSSTYEQLRDAVHGATRPRINLSTLKALSVGLPELEEQREIVRKTKASFAMINRLTAEATSARKLIDRLDQAVLAKAFRGELVQQDLNDEPASVLLERIGVERETRPTAKPRRHRQR